MDSTNVISSALRLKLWEANKSPESHDLIWKTGTIDLLASDYPGGRKLKTECFGIRFDPAGVRQLLSDAGISSDREKAVLAPLGSTEPLPVKHAGGRPSKPYWEDAIVEMFDQLFYGTLTPVSQADIETAMKNWISEKYDDHPSEASIRERAKKVWRVQRKEG